MKPGIRDLEGRVDQLGQTSAPKVPFSPEQLAHELEAMLNAVLQEPELLTKPECQLQVGEVDLVPSVIGKVTATKAKTHDAFIDELTEPEGSALMHLFIETDRRAGKWRPIQ